MRPNVAAKAANSSCPDKRSTPA